MCSRMGRARRAGCGIASTRRRCGSCRGRRWRRPGMEIILGRWRIRGESSRLKPLLQKPRREVRDGEREGDPCRSEEHTSELQSLMRNSYAVFCLKKKKKRNKPKYNDKESYIVTKIISNK